MTGTKGFIRLDFMLNILIRLHRFELESSNITNSLYYHIVYQPNPNTHTAAGDKPTLNQVGFVFSPSHRTLW